jgi:hypothetical protein
MTYLHYIGVDVGQSADPTAICVLEPRLWATEHDQFQMALPGTGWLAPSTLVASQADYLRSTNYHGGCPPNIPLAVTHLERMALGTRYAAIIERVQRLSSTPPLRAALSAVVIDATGVGRPVVEQFRQAGVPNIQAVTITAGHAATFDPVDEGWRTPKRDLVSAVAIVLEQRCLEIAERLPEATTLVSELQQFRRRVTPTGSDQYGSWRESAHDDLVLALALAVWFRAYINRDVDAYHAEAARPAPSPAPRRQQGEYR